MFDKEELIRILEALATKSICYDRIIRANDFSCKEELESLKNEMHEIEELRKKVRSMIAE